MEPEPEPEPEEVSETGGDDNNNDAGPDVEGPDGDYGIAEGDAGARPLGVDSPGRMELSEYERNLALNIKEAIASVPDLDPVTDFMCVQLALIDGDNIEEAIERVRHLQGFREEYKILDTAEDGKKIFTDYIALFPEMHLCFTYSPEGGNYVMVYDNQKFSCSEIKSEEKLRSWLGGTYYSAVAVSPDFEAIRSGVILVAECQGYNWKSDWDFKSLKRVWSEVAAVYPLWYARMKYFNANTSMNIVATMLKPFLPKHCRKKIEFGCQSEQRLDQIYMVPTVEAANLRLLARLEETLDRRYQNERNFRL